MEIDSIIGKKSRKIEIGDLLQKTANELRQEYIDYIGQLQPADDNLYWWLTSASEKNPRISDIFLNTCYLTVVLKIIEDTESDLVIVCESRGLAKAIQDHVKNSSGMEVSIHERILDRLRQRIIFFTRSAFQYGFFLIRWTLRCILAHGYSWGMSLAGNRSPQHLGKKVLIHSWTDQRSFRNAGKYEEVYLGTLGDELKKRGLEVIYLIDVLPTLFYPAALNKLRRLDLDFILMEQFYNPVDVFYAAFVGIFKTSHQKKIPHINDYDVSALVTEEFQKDRLHPRAAQTFLCYIIGKKLARTIPFQSFIYSFENLMWEKMFCVSIRESTQDVDIIGYAHSVIDPMYLFYTLSEHEVNSAPLPDRIIVNGIMAKNTLIRSGFPASRIFIGGALRYPHLGKVLSKKEVTPQKTILIATSAGIGESIELIEKSRQAFGDKKDIRCIIKVHPTIPLKKIKTLTGLPHNFSISNDPADRLFSTIDLMVYTSSAISVEAVACGIKILHVKSDFTIDMNIFTGFPTVQSVSTPQELYSKACEEMNRPPPSGEYSAQVVNGFFAPVTQESIGLFVPYG